MAELPFEEGYRSGNLTLVVQEKHHDKLLGFAIKRCQELQLDRMAAEDALQELYVKILKKPELFRNGLLEKGPSYLFTTIKHFLLNQYRRTQLH